ncbi:MAG: hypothetical protein RLZZ618_230 [Pseudomonadota bacterium]|jgi:polyisoprenoid-binding protein YceI
MIPTLPATLVTVTTLLAAGAAPSQEAKYRIDPSHTAVVFEVKHFGVSTTRGRFDREEGVLIIDKTAKTGKVEIHIDMTSVNTGLADVDARLQGRDFFNVEHFPKSRFVGDEVSFNGDKLVSVSGTLVMMGKSVPVTLNAISYGCYNHPELQHEVCGGDFEATLQRSAWGLSFGLPGVAPDSVRLLIQVEAIKR